MATDPLSAYLVLHPLWLAEQPHQYEPFAPQHSSAGDQSLAKGLSSEELRCEPMATHKKQNTEIHRVRRCVSIIPDTQSSALCIHHTRCTEFGAVHPSYQMHRDITANTEVISVLPAPSLRSRYSVFGSHLPRPRYRNRSAERSGGRR
jgi:hypothetical protein